MLRAFFRRLPLAASLIVLLVILLPSGTPAASAQSLASDAAHFYVGVDRQAPTNATGIYAYLSQNAPYVADADLESLAQIDVFDNFQTPNRVLEVGWMVVPSLYIFDKTKPHLFIFTRDKDKPSSDNCLVQPSLSGSGGWTCDFVSLGAPNNPGDTLVSDGTVRTFSIIHMNSAFYIQYDANYIGYIPDSHWGGAFPVAGADWQAEVGVAGMRPCTDMGDGTFGTQTGSAHIYTMTWVTSNGYVPLNEQGGAPTVSGVFHGAKVPTDYVSKLYNGSKFENTSSGSYNSFSYGGPGSC